MSVCIGRSEHTHTYSNQIVVSFYGARRFGEVDDPKWCFFVSVVFFFKFYFVFLRAEIDKQMIII